MCLASSDSLVLLRERRQDVSRWKRCRPSAEVATHRRALVALVGIREAPRYKRVTHARILDTLAMTEVLPPAQHFASTMRGQGL